MDDFDFRAIDKHMEAELKLIEVMPEKPPEFILIPVGEYDGVDLPDCIIDEDYIVWLEIPNPEWNCEVSM